LWGNCPGGELTRQQGPGPGDRRKVKKQKKTTNTNLDAGQKLGKENPIC